MNVREAKIQVWESPKEPRLQGMHFTAIVEATEGHAVFESPITHRPVVLLPRQYILED